MTEISPNTSSDASQASNTNAPTTTATPMATGVQRRFRTNPIELVIFAVISLVFFNSVYTLFYDHQGFRPAALQPMAANPVSESQTTTAVSTVGNLDTRCDAAGDQDTAASKVRLTGALCMPEGAAASGRSPASTERKIQKAVITNTANKFSATVFTDAAAGKYSTDYIPLNAGRNPIHVELTYADGKSFEQDFVVNRLQ